VPIGWVIDGANRNDSILLAPTLDDLDRRGLLGDVETIWLDRGYDSDVTRIRLVEQGITDAVIAKKRKRGSSEGPKHQPMGLRWPVERTNSWLSNFGHYAETPTDSMLTAWRNSPSPSPSRMGWPSRACRRCSSAR